ncbi:MAG: Uma2 family endonuclease [Deltaproteobacteria bacterium]|nr:Uma2 family endonuclease [Deltaproteobacteria bacterium]
MSEASRRKLGPHRWADFVALEEDDLRELIDGELVEVEVPGFVHERIIMRLGFFLTGWSRDHGAELLASGYKVRISDVRGVMPDLQLYREGNSPSPDQDAGLVTGCPDLVVEVVSPRSSRRYDRVVKLGYYAAKRVPEYWIVDPDARTVERLVLTGTLYAIAGQASGDEVFAPASFRGLRIPLGELWAGPTEHPPTATKRRKKKTAKPARKARALAEKKGSARSR